MEICCEDPYYCVFGILQGCSSSLIDCDSLVMNEYSAIGLILLDKVRSSTICRLHQRAIYTTIVLEFT